MSAQDQKRPGILKLCRLRPKPANIVQSYEDGSSNPLKTIPEDDPLKPNKGTYKMSQGPTESVYGNTKPILNPEP